MEKEVNGLEPEKEKDEPKEEKVVVLNFDGDREIINAAINPLSYRDNISFVNLSDVDFGESKNDNYSLVKIKLNVRGVMIVIL